MLLGIVSLDVNAQQLPSYIFQHIDYSDGLLSNDVESILQDDKGFVWLGSMKGLQRYDGHRFVNYPDTTVNISTNMAALNLYSDNTNNYIEYINNGRLMRWKGWQNKLDAAESKKNFKGESYSEGNGQIRLIGKQRMCKYDVTGKIISAFFPWMRPDSSASGFFPAVKEKDNDSIWFAATTEDPFIFNTKSKRIYTLKQNEIHHPFLQQWDDGNYGTTLGGVVRLDSRGNIWWPTWSEVFLRYNMTTKKLNVYHLSDIIHLQESAKITYRIVDIMEDNHGIIWLATQSAGLLRYDPETNKFSVIQYDPKNRLSIQYNTDMRCLFQDREENIWIGTDRGISVFNPYRQNFNVLRVEQDKTPSLQKNMNTVIQSSKGDILVGNWGDGITVFDKEYNFKKAITFSDNKEKNLVWSFVQNDDGNIWAGCQHGWLHIINPNNFSVESIQPAELEKSTVWCMKKDWSGNILFGLNNGKIAAWNKATKKFYSFNNHLQQIIGKSPVVNIFIDHNQNCWASTWNGFKQFDFIKQIFTATYQPDKSNPKSIASLRCTGIEEYNDSILVIGTQLGGLNFFNKYTKTFSRQPIGEDPANNSVFAIKKDSTGNIWLATDFNIYKYNPNNKKFIACNIEKGMITAPFTEKSSFYSAPGGQWFITTNAEVLRFYPDNIIEHSQTQNPVAITGFKVSGKPIFIDSFLHANQPVHLEYRQNFITIEFSALNFSSSQQIKYYYQLDGINKDWVDAGVNSFANYTNLPAGKYLFHVKTNNTDEHEKITSFTIIIATPFWQTWWFIALLVLIAASLVYLFYRYRLSQVLKLQKVRNRIATDLHDDIGSSLTNINILSQLSKQHIAQPEQETFLKRISEEVNLSAQALDDIIWSVNTLNDTMEQTVARMRRYAAELFDAGNVQYEFEMAPDLAEKKMSMELRRDFYLIYKEAVNNICKHAGANQVHIKIGIEKNNMQLIIKDNGKGFDSMSITHRNGLKNLDTRVERWKGHLDIHSQKNKGTIITATLPLV